MSISYPTESTPSKKEPSLDQITSKSTADNSDFHIYMI